ncbi:MAG: type II toxin-antitoxin system VapC family toxin [Deltaproteobacteria bacterium]|nr:type II toxin-antitoxin system VapC family toxin [Deltaproteobacteria bacterium]
MNLVIDASVVIKVYIPEILSDKSEEVMSRVADGELMLWAPDLLYPETGNILWRKQRLHELTPAEVEEIVDAITYLPIRIEQSRPVMPLAVSIAMHSGITVYDAMYVAVARIYETRMITADRKLVDALEKTEFKQYVQWLGAGIG